jgi:hypothetical protein
MAGEQAGQRNHDMIHIDRTTNRLEAIAARQSNGRKRDLIFACFVTLAAIIGASTVGAAVHGASIHLAQG